MEEGLSPNNNDVEKISLPINWPDEFFLEPKELNEVQSRVIKKPSRKPISIPPIEKEPSLEEFVVVDKNSEPILNKMLEKIKVNVQEKEVISDPLMNIDHDLILKMELERQGRDKKRQDRKKKEAEKRSIKKYRKARREKRKVVRKIKTARSKTLIEKTLNEPVGKLLKKTPILGPFLIQRANAPTKPKKPKGPSINERIQKKIHDIKLSRMQRLQKNIVGLEINESTIRAVRSKGGKMTLVEKSIPPGIIVNGILEEGEELSEELKEFWRENKLGSNQVNFSISNKLTKLSVVSIPAKTKEDALQALVMSVAEIIDPMDVEKSIIDYAELNQADKNFSFQVVAADKDMIRDFITSIEKAGLYAVSCEIGVLAAARSFAIPRSKNSFHFFVQINPETTSIAILKGHDVMFLRNIALGTRDFSLAIQESVGCSIFEADIIRDKVSLSQESQNIGLDPDIYRSSKTAMIEVADRLVQEISQTKNFFASQLKKGTIQTWSLIGEGSLIGGLDRQIEVFASLPESTPTQAWPGFEKINALPLKSTAVGLSTEYGMSLIPRADFSGIKPVFKKQSKINLNRSERTAKELAREHGLIRPKYSPRLIGGVLAALVLVAGFYFKNNIQSSNSNKQAEIIRLQEEISQKNQSGLFPIYTGPERSIVESAASGIILQPNKQLTREIIQFLNSSDLIADYTLKTDSNNYTLEVTFNTGAKTDEFESGLGLIGNIGVVTESGKSVDSQARDKISYLIGGYTGVSE